MTKLVHCLDTFQECFYKIVLLLQLLQPLLFVYGYPVRSPSESLEYLKRFGYMAASEELPKESSGSVQHGPQPILFRLETSRTTNRLETGLKRFQRYAGIPATGVLNTETLNLMNLPRCGNAEELHSNSKSKTKVKRRARAGLMSLLKLRKKRYILDSKWEKIYLTYTVLNYPTHGTMTREEVEAEVELAFKIWENEANLHIVRSKSPEHADIEISFVTGRHNDGIEFSEVNGVGKVIAHAWKPFNFQPLRGDIHLNDEVAWSSSSAAGEETGYSFLRTLLHEIGHALGLEHSPNPNAIMYFALNGYDSNLRLQLLEDDRNGIQQLYGKKRKRGTRIKTRSSLGSESHMAKPLVVPSGTPDKPIPWACYILQEEEPANYNSIKSCYQKFYQQYYKNLHSSQNE